MAILDLKESEARNAAEELTTSFGMSLSTPRRKTLDSFLAFTVESGEVEKGKLDVVGISCDVSSEQSVQKAFGAVMTRFGRVDSVIASAGEPKVSRFLQRAF